MINPQYDGIVCMETAKLYKPLRKFRKETAYIVSSTSGTKLFIDFNGETIEEISDINKRRYWKWTTKFGPPTLYLLSEREISPETHRRIKAAGLDKLVAKS